MGPPALSTSQGLKCSETLRISDVWSDFEDFTHFSMDLIGRALFAASILGNLFDSPHPGPQRVWRWVLNVLDTVSAGNHGGKFREA